MSNGDGDGFRIVEERSVPDIYADSVGFQVSVYGITLEFGISQNPPPRADTRPTKVPPIVRMKVHMSPQHAKVMAKVFVKNMKTYEDQIGKIPIPAQLLKELGLEEEW